MQIYINVFFSYIYVYFVFQVLTVPHAGGGGNPQRFKFSIQNQQDASSFQCLKKTHQG